MADEKLSKQPDTPSKKSRLTKWAETIYADDPDYPLSLTWTLRLKKVSEKLGYTLTEAEQIQATNEYFENHAAARAYWSLFRLYQNVCQSVEEPEVPSSDGKGANENQSYKTKIDNGLKLASIWQSIEDQKAKLFKGNEQGEADFRAGKAASQFKKSEADRGMERLKTKYGKI